MIEHLTHAATFFILASLYLTSSWLSFRALPHLSSAECLWRCGIARLAGGIVLLLVANGVLNEFWRLA